MKFQRMLLSLVAWIVFGVVLRFVGSGGAGWAAGGALVVAAALLVVNARTGPKILDVAAVVTFAALTLAGFAGGSMVRDLMVDYGRGACTLVLGLVMAVSAVTVPYTEQYARESVSRQYWNTRTFRTVNRKLSATWAGIVLVMAAGHFLEGMLGANGQGSPVIDALLNWVVPVALVYVGITITKRTISERSGDQQGATSQRHRATS